LVVLVGCSSDCTNGSCYPYGTYVHPNTEIGAASAEICFDTDCETVKAVEGDGDVYNGFNSSFWQAGRTVQLRLTVFDASNNVIDTLTEKRTMDPSGCACGVLFYDWKDGRLHRQN